MAAHEEGWPTKVLAPGSEGSPVNTPVPVIRMGHRGRQDWFARQALLRFLSQYPRKHDEHLIFSDPGATRAAMHGSGNLRNHSGGYSVILHGSEIPLFSSGRNCARFGRFLKGAHRIHLLSEANRALLLSRYPETEQAIRVAPGAPSSWISGHNPRREGTEHPEHFTILTVGRIHPRKGQLETLAALARLPHSLQKKIRYRIVGPVVRRKYCRQIESLARKTPISLELTGAIPDQEMPGIYGSADIFALNSQPVPKSIEGFGLVYLDASAFGLPIVANRIGGVTEAVIENQTGLTAPPDDPVALTDIFQRILADPSLRDRLGRNGRKYALGMSWNKSLTKVWRS